MSNDAAAAQIVLKIHGMDCAEEVAILKRELGPLVNDIERLRFDVLNGKLVINDAVEFNYYYVRGLAAFAIQNGVNALQIYRAKSVRVPRSSSIAKIGMLLPSDRLLADLRLNHLDAVLGIPAGPNSGLSVRIPVGV